jgi:hypothetical protein
MHTKAPSRTSDPRSINRNSTPDPRVNTEYEFLGAADARRIFGLSRTFLYRLAAQGKIRTASLRENGKRHGKRLFEAASIREFLASRIEVISTPFPDEP